MMLRAWHLFKRMPELGVLLIMALITGAFSLWLGTGFVVPDEREYDLSRVKVHRWMAIACRRMN